MNYNNTAGSQEGEEQAEGQGGELKIQHRLEPNHGKKKSFSILTP